MNRSRVILGLKILLSAGFVLLLVQLVDVRKIGRVLLRPRAPAWWILSAGAQAGVVLLLAWSWRLLFSLRKPMNWRIGLRGTLVVLFMGTFSPGRFSARLSAPFVFRGLGDDRDLGFCTAVVYLHTATYLTAYGIAGLAGLVVLAWTGVRTPASLLAIPVGIYLLAGGVLLGSAWWIRSSGEAVTVNDDLYPWPISRLMSGWESILRSQARHLEPLTSRTRPLMGVMLLLGLSVTVLPGLRIYGLFRGLGTSYSPWILMVVLPALYSVTILPVSIGGIGLAEGSAVGVLVLLGLDASVSVPVVVLDRVLSVYLPALIGWVLFVTSSGGSKVTNSTSAEE